MAVERVRGRVRWWHPGQHRGLVETLDGRLFHVSRAALGPKMKPPTRGQQVRLVVAGRTVQALEPCSARRHAAR